MSRKPDFGIVLVRHSAGHVLSVYCVLAVAMYDVLGPSGEYSTRHLYTVWVSHRR